MKDKLFLGTELLIGKQIYLPKHSGSFSMIDYKNGKFVLNEKETREYIRELKNVGVNSFRSLIPYYEPVDLYDKEGEGRLYEYEIFSPFAYLKDKKTFDLTKWNNNFFTIMKKILRFIIDENTYFVYPIVDNCAYHGKSGFFYNNKQNVGLYDKGAMKYILKYIDKIIKEFGTKNIIFELGNEIHGVDFAFSIYEHLLKRGVKPEMISLGINLNLNTNDPHGNDMKELRGKIRSKYGVDHLRKSFFVVHGHLKKDSNRFGKLTDFAMFEAEWIQPKNSNEKKFNIRTFISTDGTGDGDSKCDVHPRKQAVYRRRPSYSQWEKWYKLIFSEYYLTSDDGLPLIYAEQFIKVQDIKCQKPFFEKVSRLYKKYFGDFPYNYGKFPKDEPQPDPDPSPLPEPEPNNDEGQVDQGCSCWYWLKEWNFKRFFMCILCKEKKKCK